ncbi:MAG: SAV_6107 family HEPN domain-containing protein [Actinomycetes bacterium]
MRRLSETAGQHVSEDLRRARSALAAAELAPRPADRFLAAHLAALRVAAVVLAVRARPRGTSGRPRSAWTVLAEVAPELAEWAGFFASGHAKREAVRTGAATVVTVREADDLVRDAQTFLTVVEATITGSAAAVSGERALRG